MGQCKKDVTSLLKHIFLALTHRYVITWELCCHPKPVQHFYRWSIHSKAYHLTTTSHALNRFLQAQYTCQPDSMPTRKPSGIQDIYSSTFVTKNEHGHITTMKKCVAEISQLLHMMYTPTVLSLCCNSSLTLHHNFFQQMPHLYNFHYLWWIYYVSEKYRGNPSSHIYTGIYP